MLVGGTFCCFWAQETHFCSLEWVKKCVKPLVFKKEDVILHPIKNKLTLKVESIRGQMCLK